MSNNQSYNDSGSRLHKDLSSGFISILAYAGWARSASASQNLAVLPKRHDNILFPRR